MGRGAAHEEYPDDGHIFVCVRVRNAPQNAACLTHNSAAATNTRASAVLRKSVLREAQRICVSVVENVVVMHDPTSIDDDATVAKDGNNVVQMLTDRAHRTGATRHSRKAAGGGSAAAALSRTSSRRTAGGSRVTTAGAAAGATHIISTSTANYYECDHCIVSMEESHLLQMPLIRTSDFLQPPPYGTQEEVYRRTAMHAVKAAIDGINSCVFAYGQTGSGKTYTLFGDTTNIRRDPGVVPRTLDDLFSRLEAVKQSYQSDRVIDYSYRVQLSFYEIYQNEVYCLFSRRGPLHVQFVRDPTGRKETMIIHDLQQQTVTSAEKAYPMIEVGLRRRQTAETGMNSRSSRSHAVLQVRVAQYRTNCDTRETVEHQATINLVDLAGSERQKTANTSGTSRAEGIQINQSLATLARVINDIASGAKFVNYRDSLLTMVLKDNLGGNSKTFMIANISPIAFSYQESCATLTYARDVRKIRNRPMVNKTFQTRANLLEQNMTLKQENEKLKEQMEAWVRGLQSSNLHPSATDAIGLLSVRGGGMAEASDHPLLSPPPSMAQTIAAQQRRASNVPLAVAGCNEAFLSTSSAGLTAPLLISSHRKYTSIAGIGGSCVEGGVVRVTALVKGTMEFPLSRVLYSLPSTTTTGESLYAAGEDGHNTQKRHTAILMGADANSSECASGGNTCRPDTAVETTAAVAEKMLDLGSLVLERVAQRSCEQRYYVHFNPPASVEGLSRLIDVQINGKSVGEKGRRELHHGDVVCAYLEDGAKAEAATETAASACLHAQSLISFHYVDLNALSRGTNTSSNGMSSATLGQIAVSVDLPADMESLTLEDIKQLQRDNAKLLDMVRQQAETIDYQCAHASTSMGQAENLEGISPIETPGSVSPNPRSLEPSVSTSLPPETSKIVVALEAFRRLSVSPSIRRGSVMPADLETDELLQRAAAQSESKQRLDSAVHENEKLHRTVVSRNATLEALARRLAELEAGGPLDTPTTPSASSSPSSVSISPSAKRDDMDEVQTGRCADVDEVGNNASMGTERDCSSVTRVSSPSQMRTAFEQRRDEGVVEADEEDGLQLEPIGDGRKRIVYESTEGTRERYQAVVREREQFDRIIELETLMRELRERISELESRLRFSKDETLEQQMFREQAEDERDALLEELANTRSENAMLRRENASLEGFLARDEQALADAARLADEELERQTAVLTDRIKALKALARMWKQRTMKYIAMGYGAGSDDKGTGSARAAHLEAIPWDDLRAAETAAIAKRRLGGGDADACPADVAHTIDDFEKSTTEDNVRALEYALLDFEQENQRLLDRIRHIQAELDGYKSLIGRLRAEKAETEKALADATDSTEEERRRMQQLLRSTNAQLEEAEENLKRTQGRLDDAVGLCENNKRKAVRNNGLLLAQQKRTIEELEAEIHHMRRDYAAKDEELTNLTRYMQDRDALGGDGVAQNCKLHSRIEELVKDSMEDYEAPNGYSVFPAGFEFSDEMVSLIRICLRILLDRLKMELYVLNAQSVHKFQLLIHAVKARTEAHFHTFVHQLRDAVSQMAGRTLRPGGKWGLSESDVLSTLVDHRRRQVGDALSGLLIWYDHWDSAPKTEHVAYMELIRNADRIMQMARIVRRESLLNTNATSTSLMPIPGKNGASDISFISESARRNDKTVKGSCKILSRLASFTRQGNLARAVNQFSATPSRATIAGREGVVGTTPCPVEEGTTPFSRSATVTALALSQSMIPFSRTGTGTRINGHQPPPAANPESCSLFSRCPSGLPRPLAATVAVANLSPQSCLSTATPARPTKPAASGVAGTPAATLTTGTTPAAPTAAARANYSRMASAGVLPVSEADVDYVANTDVAEAVSISTYNFSRRMSLAATMGAGEGTIADKGEPVRRPSRLFSQSQKSIFQQRDSSQHQQQPLRRLVSATPALSKSRVNAGATGTRVQASRVKATEAFARSKTHYSVLKPTEMVGRLSRRNSGACVSSKTSTHTAGSLGGGSPHARPSSSQHNASRLSAFYSTPAAVQMRGSGNGPVSMLSSNAAAKPSSGEVSFYNPDVMKSLRERSTNDVNSAARASSEPRAVSKKASLTGSSSVHLKKSKAHAATSLSAFQKALTGARVSAGHDTTVVSSAPVIPKLNFEALEEKP